jgi:hypothetical protein
MCGALWCVGAVVFAGVAHAQQPDRAPTEAVHPYTTPEEKRDVADFVLGSGLTVGGLVEVEASVGREEGRGVSDIVLATLELGVEAEPADWVRANAVLLWEEDDTEPVDLDVATITLGGNSRIPFVLEAGKLYIPFGAFNSHFVSDPLVLELGETRESAAVLAYANGPFEVKLGAFNGNLDAESDDDRTDDLVAAATFAPAPWVSFGAYWVSDLGESDVLEEGLSDALEGPEDAVEEGPGTPYHEEGGAGGFASLQIEPFAVEVEYISALDNFDAGLLSDRAMEPKAWNVEFAWAPIDVMEVAVRCEGSDEFPGMPETQYGACTTYALTENTTVALEYLHGEYDDETGDRDLATAQVAVEF